MGTRQASEAKAAINIPRCSPPACAKENKTQTKGQDMRQRHDASNTTTPKAKREAHNAWPNTQRDLDPRMATANRCAHSGHCLVLPNKSELHQAGTTRSRWGHTSPTCPVVHQSHRNGNDGGRALQAAVETAAVERREPEQRPTDATMLWYT